MHTFTQQEIDNLKSLIINDQSVNFNLAFTLLENRPIPPQLYNIIANVGTNEDPRKGIRFLFEKVTQEKDRIILINKLLRGATLDLSRCHLQELPKEMKHVSKLRVLRLDNNNLEEIPTWIGEINSLQSLYLDNNSLKTIPASIAKLDRLQVLSLSNNHISSLPDFFSHLTNLKNLNLERNRLKVIPQSLRKCVHLHTLLLKGNIIYTVPDVLLYLHKLRNFSGIPGFNLQQPKKELLELKEILAKTNLTEKQCTNCLMIFHQKKRQVQKLTPSELIEALKVPHDTLQIRTLDRISEIAHTALKKHPLQAGSSITFLGKTNFNKNEVRSQCKELGINYSSKLQEQLTHIIIGLGADNTAFTTLQELDKGQITYLTEKELQQFFNEATSPYLLEENDTQEGSIQNIATLVYSGMQENMALAVEILKGGGTPKELIEELILITKYAKDAKVRKEATKLVELSTKSSNVKKILKDRSRLQFKGRDAEKKMYKLLLKLWKSAKKDINWDKLAYGVYKCSGNGLRFFFDFCKDEAFRSKVLSEHIKGSSLNYYAMYATYAPDYLFQYSYNHYQPTEFPKEILSFSDLTTLDVSNCRIAYLPDEISQLENLQELSIHGNFLLELPTTLSQLKKLRKLDISNNEFKQFPSILKDCTQLEEVNISNNRKQWSNNPFHKIPDEIKQALPNTNFIL